MVNEMNIGATTNTNTLAQVIEKYRKPSINADHDANVVQLRQKILELLNQPLFPIEQDKVYETLNQAVRCLFCYKLSQRYPVVSKSIFELVTKREEKVDGVTYEAKLPVVVRLPLSKAQNGSEFKDTIFVYPVDKTEYNRWDSKRAEIWCPIPRITSEARTAIAESVAYRAQIIAEAYRDTLFAKILEKNMVKHDSKNIASELLENIDFQLIWAPSKWNMKYVEKDPAILMNYNNANFMVHQWEIPEEKSLDTVLMEFGEDFANPEEKSN
jgi:hypothetical protein